MSIVLTPFGSDLYQQEVALREKVLRKPLGLSFPKEELQGEGPYLHFVACEEKRVIGCVFLCPEEKDARLRQMVVDPAFQGRKIGAALVRALEAEAKTRGFEKIVLHGRVSALGFYKKLGYHATGARDSFLGVPHQEMEKTLLCEAGEIVSVPFGSDLYRQGVFLRKRILLGPVGASLSAEDLAKEEEGLHFAALDGTGRVIGYVFMVGNGASARLRHMVVDPAFQGKKIGAALVRHLEAEAASRGVRKIVLWGRESAVGFYRKCGYCATGETGSFASLSIHAMEKSLEA